MTVYRLTPYNQIDDYGQEKVWKIQKQAQTLRKRKSQIAFFFFFFKTYIKKKGVFIFVGILTQLVLTSLSMCCAT
jgi:hypothetical protein